MCKRVLITALLGTALPAFSLAAEQPSVPFADGRWTGSVVPLSNGAMPVECWASTVQSDGTTLTLAKDKSGSWHLRLSNPEWDLRTLHQYDMAVLVDFYMQLQVSAVAKSTTSLEIAALEEISLLGFIENGHSIKMSAEGFHENYDLEGSAKIIQKIRSCKTG